MKTLFAWAGMIVIGFSMVGCKTSETSMRSSDSQTVYVRPDPGYSASQSGPNELKIRPSGSINEPAGAQQKPDATGR